MFSAFNSSLQPCLFKNQRQLTDVNACVISQLDDVEYPKKWGAMIGTAMLICHWARLAVEFTVGVLFLLRYILITMRSFCLMIYS
jgi:hypothetical protein